MLADHSTFRKNAVGKQGIPTRQVGMVIVFIAFLESFGDRVKN
jgi:hypothetical protein